MKKLRLAAVLRDVLQENLFPSRTAVGREFVVELLATPEVFDNLTEIGARLNGARNTGRQARLPLAAGRRA